MCNQWHTQCALSGCTKKFTLKNLSPFTPRGYIAPGSIIHNHLYTYNIHIHFTVGCTEGALLGCSKTESLRTRWYVLSKTKTCRIIIEVFHFYATCFILLFILRKLFKTVGEILHLLTLYPKLIFRCALKKNFMLPVDRSIKHNTLKNLP